MIHQKADMSDIRIFIIVLMIVRLCDSKDVTVNTNIGVIQGAEENIEVFGENFVITKYLGIPYAEPPVGDLRFSNPIPKKRFDEPLKALKHGNACLQFEVGLQPKGNISYSEDCLYLNIYSPILKKSNEKLAVLIWIHGGGYVTGSADGYVGDHLAAYGGVIVVTINYRLSLWGFLFSGDGNSPGNYALMDQQIAIKWIRDNIEVFGGDPERITLFGESSGAANVMWHGLHAGNKGLIHRIIAQSGGAASWWSMESVSKRKEDVVRLARLAECDVTTMEVIITCLKSVPGQKLLDIINNPRNGFKVLPIAFIPTVDNEFIKVSNENLFNRESKLSEADKDFFMSLDLMMGTNNGDGSGALGKLYGVKDAENFLPDFYTFEKIFVPALIKRVYSELNLEDSVLKDVIAAEYTNWEDPHNSLQIREEIMSMHADSTYTGPMHLALNFHSDSNSGTYMYYFEDYTSNHLFCNISWFKTMSHGAEIPLVFGYKNSDKLTDWQFYPTDSEREWSKRVIKLWSNFAKTGNPNRPNDVGLDWLKYTRQHQHYLQISRDMTSSNVKQRLNTRRANFWAHLVPALTKSLNRNNYHSTEKDTCQKGEECHP